MNRVLFINGQKQVVADIFTALAPDGFETRCIAAGGSDEETIHALRDIDFLVLHPARLSGEIVRSAPSLKLVQLLTAGFDKVDVAAAKAAGIPVATNGGANSWAVAEHAVSLILALYKKLLACDASVRAGTWRQPLTGFNTFEIAGKTVGIVGAGNIGRKVAARLKAFETNIIYYDRRPAPEMEDTLGARQVSLEELATQADIITIHAPLLDSTRGMIGRGQFAAMKKTAILINTSRAELVDEAALVDALRDGTIAGAGIDVYSSEPVSADHPLLQCDNVIVTPHSAGHSFEGWTRRSQTAWSNIARVAKGEAPEHVVQIGL